MTHYVNDLSYIFLNQFAAYDPQATLMQVLAYSASVAALVFALMLAKDTITGVLGSKVGGALKGVQNSLGKKSQDIYSKSAFGRGRAIRDQAKANYKTQKFADNLASGKGIRGRYTKLAAGGLTGIRPITPGQKKADDSLARQAFALSEKAENEEIGAAESLMTKQANLNSDERQIVATGGKVTKNGTVIDGKNTATQKAAIRLQANGKHDDIQKLVDAGLQGEMAQTLASSLASSSSRPSWIGQKALEDIGQGKSMNSDKMMDAAIESNAYSAEKIAGGDQDELEAIARRAADPNSGASTAAKQQLINNAHSALTDPLLAAKVSKNVLMVDHIRHNTAPPPRP